MKKFLFHIIKIIKIIKIKKMKKIEKIIAILLLVFAVSCSNDNNIVQKLTQAPAIVREVKGANDLFVFDLQNSNNGLYSQYIVPSAALPADYKQDGLPVLISGDVTNNSVAIDGYISESKGNNITLSGKYNTVEVTTMSKNEGETYYVVGYDGTSEVDEQKGTAKSGGYLFVSEKYKDLLLENNLPDNIYAHKLDGIILLTNLIIDDLGNRLHDTFDGIVDFPEESMPKEGYCGYRLFPEEYRFAFKVQMTYRPMTEEEERYVPRMINAMCYNPLAFNVKFNCIVITSILKINKP
jgi:hypothetical protein